MGSTAYRQHKGRIYEVHYPERNQKAWGFGAARLGEKATIKSTERMAAHEVWSRYRTLCASGEPFDVELEFMGEPVHQSVILAIGRLANGECDRFALWLPAQFLTKARFRTTAQFRMKVASG